MIDRSEILEVATDLSLAPEVVEKDYVLAGLLAGIYRNEELASAWTFKGGTCLKKCYFETYRFSEYLDFTITAEVADGRRLPQSWRLLRNCPLKLKWLISRRMRSQRTSMLLSQSAYWPSATAISKKFFASR